MHISRLQPHAKREPEIHCSLVPPLAVRKTRRGSGVFSHVSKIRIKRMIERVLVARVN